MTSLDDDLVPAVLELVDELGAAATYVSISTAYDPATTDVNVARQNFTIKVTPPQAAKEFAEGEAVEVRDLETIIAASGPISPGALMPASITANLWSAGSRRVRVSGTPRWLLRLPSVAITP